MNDDRLDDLAVLYVGLAHGVDGRMHFNEFTQIADHLIQWRHPGDRRDVLEVVEHAVANHAPADVEAATDRLGRTMSERERRAVMEDLSQIALADRRFLAEEAEYIGEVATAWNVHPSHDDRGAFWSVLRARTLVAARSAVHDLALLYLTVAIVPDADASVEELQVIRKTLSGWLPDALTPQIDAVVRTALVAYSKGFSSDQMGRLLERVAASMPKHQARAVAQDLRAIACADGEMSVEERTWIARIEERLMPSAE